MGKTTDPPPSYGDPPGYSASAPPPSYTSRGYHVNENARVPRRQEQRGRDEERDDGVDERSSLLGRLGIVFVATNTSPSQENAHSYTTFPPPQSNTRYYRQRQRRQRQARTPCRRLFIFLAATVLALCLVLALNYAVWMGLIGDGTGDGPMPRPEPLKKTVRVAVVGAGPAGVGFASVLGREFGADGSPSGLRSSWWSGRQRRVEIEVEITIFERNTGVGGRMLLDLSPNNTHAFGPKGLLAQDLATSSTSLLASSSVIRARAEQHLGSRWVADSEARLSKVAFFSPSRDGGKVEVMLPRPVAKLSVWERLELWWRYGGAVSKAADMAKAPREGMARFVALRETYGGMGEMLRHAGGGVATAVAKSAADVVHDPNNGVGEKYVHEILSPQLRRQLGQDVSEISEFALGVALWRESQVGGELTVGGRMEEAMELLLERSGVKIDLGTEVLDAKRRKVEAMFGKDKWQWDLKLVSKDGDLETESFDHVVVAAPLEGTLKQNLDFHANISNGDEGVSYRSVYVTMVLVDGGLSTVLVGNSNVDVSEVLPIQGDSKAEASWLEGVHEISHVRDVYGPDADSSSVLEVDTNTDSNITTQAVHSLYRVTSSKPIPQSTLSRIFSPGKGTIKAVHEQKIEKGWPLLWPRGLDEVTEGKDSGFSVRSEKEGGEQDLWSLDGYEGFVGAGGVDAAWVVGENLGRVVGERIRGGA